MSTDTPTLGQLLQETIDATIGRLNVSLPGVVVSYDAARQSATIQPSLNGRWLNPDTEAVEPLSLPLVLDVPVMWPSWAGGQAAVCGDLEPGDRVLLVICDRSIAEWKAAVSQPVTPSDPRRCNLSDAMAFPGGSPPSAGLLPGARPAPEDPPGTIVVSGARVKLAGSAAADPLVTESRMLAVLGEIVVAFNLHTHAETGVTTAVPTVPLDPPAPGSLGSPTVVAP